MLITGRDPPTPLSLSVSLCNGNSSKDQTQLGRKKLRGATSIKHFGESSLRNRSQPHKNICAMVTDTLAGKPRMHRCLTLDWQSCQLCSAKRIRSHFVNSALLPNCHVHPSTWLKRLTFEVKTEFAAPSFSTASAERSPVCNCGKTVPVFLELAFYSTKPGS